MNPNPESSSGRKPRLVFVANSMYSRTVSGGEVHNFNLVAGALAAGYKVHFVCGHALKVELDRRQIPATITLTDGGLLPTFDYSSLSEQFRLLGLYFRRLRASLKTLQEIRPEDVVYSTTEFWWDYVPAVRCSAKRKILYLGMDAPSLEEIILKSRPDVKAVRLPSLHYWMAQQFSLRGFRKLPNKRLIFAHENQSPRLLRMGYRPQDLVFVGNGVDLHQPRAVSEQEKIYDVVWVGRVHKQKGIEDLMTTLVHLAKRIPGFRAAMVGDLRQTLGPQVEAAGLGKVVEFSGYVSEAEKYRYLKSSRVFLMPSRYESWGIVVGEALASNLPVVAYDLECYRPVFGDLVRYVDCFDSEAYKRAAEDTVLKARAGQNVLDQHKLERFIQDNSWQKVGERFLEAVRSLEPSWD